MADQGEIKAAEQRGYAKGYAAGKRRQGGSQEDVFWEQSFLTVLGGLLDGHHWEMDGKRVLTMEERVELARRTADQAITARARRLR